MLRIPWENITITHNKILWTYYVPNDREKNPKEEYGQFFSDFKLKEIRLYIEIK